MPGKKRQPTTGGRNPDWTIGEDGVKVLGELVGYNLRRANAIQRQRFADAFREYRIRPVQLSMLGLIQNNPDLIPSELGRVLEIKHANIVPLIDELVERGLVERKHSKADGRIRVLAMTRKGQRLTEKLIARHQRLERDIARQLGARNRKQLLELLAAYRSIGPPEGLED